MDSKHGIKFFDRASQHFIASTDLDIDQLQVAIVEDTDKTILPVGGEIFRLSIVQL